MKLSLLLVVVCSVDARIIARPEDVTDRVGKKNADSFIEGDMIMSKGQHNAFYGLQEGRDVIVNAQTINSTLWPNAVIPYTIDNILGIDFQKIIHEAINHWQKYTCLQFVECDQNKIRNSYPHFLIFTREVADICYSLIGMRRDMYGEQKVILGPDCKQFGTVVHEIGHAIGFLHEHTRRDRNKYLTIFENNINSEFYKDNFPLQSNLLHSYNFPYDFASIMHYRMYEFSVNGKNTIAPTYEHVTETVNIGQQKELSFYDKKHANLMYKCSSQCNPKPNCENEGFVDRGCNCQCPEDYEGKLCEIRKPKPAPICGGNYNTQQDITSPNYPNGIPKGVKCIWKFTAPAGRSVQIYFSAFDLEGRNGMYCQGDTLDIRGPGFDGEVTFCGEELLDKVDKTQRGTNATYIMFKANPSPKKNNYHRGFRAHVSFV